MTVEPSVSEQQEASPETAGEPVRGDLLRYLRGRSPRELLTAALGSMFVGGLFGFFGGLVVAAIAQWLLGPDPEGRSFFTGWILSGIVIWGLSFLTYYKPSKPRLSPEVQYVAQQLESIRISLADSGKAPEAARAALTSSAVNMKLERERLWGRSRIAFAMGSLSLVAALGGPMSAIWLVTKHQDWRYFLASISMSAVMLTAGGLLLRHEGKLRTQYRQSTDEIAYFDRLRFALDCARAISDDSHRETLKQIIGYLVTPGPVLTAASRASEAESKEEMDGPLGLAGKVVDASAKVAEAALGGARKRD